jgi:hypothetical protein
MSFVIAACSPQRFWMRMVRNDIRSASNSSRRPASVSPNPVSSLIASVACNVPITPGSTPSTPPSAHDGTSPGGGGSG